MFDFSTVSTPTEDKSLSKDEVKKALANVPDKKAALQKLVSSGYKLEGFDETPAYQTPSNTGFIDTANKYLKPVGDTVNSFFSSAPRIAGNIAGLGADIVSAPFSDQVSFGGLFTGENTGGIGEKIRQAGRAGESALQKNVGVDPESGSAKVGKFGADIVSTFLMPGGVLGKLDKVGTIGKIGLGATQGAIETAKFMGASEGRIGTPTELGVGAAFGGVLPAAGAGIEYGADLLGKTTGAGGEAIRNAFKFAGTDDFVKALRGDISSEQIRNTAEDALQTIRRNRNALYGQGYENFLQKSKEVGEQNIDDITKGFLKELKGNGVKVSKDGLDFSLSKIANSGDQKLLTETLDDLKKFSKSDPEQLDILKQRLYDRFVVEKPIGTTTFAEGLAKKTAGEIKSKLVDLVPEYKALTQSYEKATEAISAISRTLSLGKPNQTMTAMTRLAQTMKDNLSYRGEALKLLEDMSGVNLTAQLSGAALNPLVGKGFAGVGQGFITGAGISGLFNPAFLLSLPIGSPRIIGEFANGLGIGAKKLTEVLSKIGAGGATKAFVSSRSSSNPFKDLAFLKSVKNGEVQGVSKEMLDVLKGAKTAKEMQNAIQKAGLTEKVKEVYSLTKSNKGFINPGQIAEDVGLSKADDLVNEARKYGSFDEFLSSKKVKNFGDIKIDTSIIKENFDRFVNSAMREKAPSGISWYSRGLLDKLQGALGKKLDSSKFKSSFGLKEIIKNDNFFNKYPSLKDQEVVLADFGVNNRYGAVIDGVIYLNTRRTPEQINSALVHEIQHRKQFLRGQKTPGILEGSDSTYNERYKMSHEVEARNKQSQYDEFLDLQKVYEQAHKK